jgi:hypothetical protein
MQKTVFWDVVACSLVDIDRRFGVWTVSIIKAMAVQYIHIHSRFLTSQLKFYDILVLNPTSFLVYKYGDITKQYFRA